MACRARSAREIDVAGWWIAATLTLLALSCDATSETKPPTDPEIPDPPPGSLLADPLSVFPPLLSETGLFPFAPDLDKVPRVAHLYVPAWELWSNGLSKHRHIVVPNDEAIGTGDPQVFAFPVGTLFFKTFSDDDGPVETRVLRLAADGWELGSYRWTEDGADADLLDMKMGTAVSATVGETSFEHRVPSLLECRQCHESSPSPILGFDELRLNHVVEEGESTELERLAGDGVLAAAPVDPLTIDEPDPVRREVRGYIHGNCSYCHNGTMGPSSSFDLRHDVALENTIGVPTDSSASAPGIRIVPGQPEASILFLAFSGETDDPEVKFMPPIGVERRDAGAIEVLRSFITALPADP
jgi:hypothetical protein